MFNNPVSQTSPIPAWKMEPVWNNVGSQKPLLPTKRKASTEPLSPIVVDKRVVQMESHANKRHTQLQSVANKSGSQRAQTPKNKTATQEISPKVQSGSSEAVRSKMRDTLAAALSVGIQNQEKAPNEENKSPSEAGKTHVDSQPAESTAANKLEDCETSASENIQNMKNDVQEPQYNYVMPDADGSFGDTFFVKDELLQGNGLSWAWDMEQVQVDEKSNNGAVQSQSDDVVVNANETENDVKSPEELASKIEAELFKLFGGVNKKYKEKGRSLMFNLKDPSNPDLREKVLSGDISPERLCSMTPEELASKELSEWRMAKAEELDKMIVLPDSDVDIRRLVKKTHKGEYQVEVEQDDAVSVEVSIGGSSSFTQFQPKKKQTQEVKEKEITDGDNISSENLTIPADGTDFMQELIVEEFKDEGFLPPIVSLDEFMESLNTEPPFENLPVDSKESKPLADKVDSETGDKTDSEKVSSKPASADPLEVDQPKAKITEALLSSLTTSDTSIERKTMPASGAVIGERVWEGELQLTISSSVSAIGLFRSGEKTSTKEWPGSMEIKGRVRLDAFEKFLQELPMSRTRAVMVVHFVLKDSSSETHRTMLSEAVDSYIGDERLGFGEPNPGVELYFCPPHPKIIEMLCRHLSKNQNDILKPTDNGLIGVVVWRRPHIFNNSSTSSQHKRHKTHNIPTRRHETINSNKSSNFTAHPVNHKLPPQPNNNNDADEDDDIPPGFGPGVAAAARDEDDLPEFNFSGNPNSSGQKIPGQVGFTAKGTQPNPSRPVDHMRALIYKYGQTASSDSGTSQWNKKDDEDDDMPEWQPQLPQKHQRPEVPIHSIHQPFMPHMVNQIGPPQIGQVVRPHMTVQPNVNVLQSVVRWPPPPPPSDPHMLPPNSAVPGQRYGGQWRLDAPRSDSMRQAAALLNDEDIIVDDHQNPSASRRRGGGSTFLNVVVLGSTGAGKSAVLNSLIGHPALPTGEGGATRAPICIDLNRDENLSNKSIVLQIDSKSQPVSASALRHSLQDRLSKISSKSRDEIYLKLKTSTAPPLKLIDLPGVEKGNLDDSLSEYAQHNDAILLVVIPAAQAPEVSSAKALRIAKEYDGECTRTIGVISKVDQASADPKVLAACQALLLGQGPRSAADIPWVTLIGQSVSIASAQSGSVGSDNSLETAWRAESESLKSILTGAPQSKLGRLALVETLAHQIRSRMKIRLPSLLSGLQGKSQIVQDELVRLGESMVCSSEGTRALALELCREFEDKFLQHIMTGEGSGWKVVASFEGNFPNRIKQLPLDRHFDINNVKRIVLEADGYQPYLISPEKGLRSLIKTVLEMAKEPSRLCVDEVHRVLVDIVSASANATPGLGRYPPFKREVVAIATIALESFKNDAKKMVVALVDMERVFVPPQHFIRLVQRRMDRQKREEEIKNKSSKKAVDAEQSLLNRSASPQTGGNLKSMKDNKPDKDAQEGPVLKVAGPDGEITAGYLPKKSSKSNGWSKKWFVLNDKTGKLGYTKKQEERQYHGVINLEECNIEEIEEEEPPAKSSKDKKSKVEEKAPSLVFKITSKVAYKTVLKAHSAVVLKAESVAEKAEWLNKLRIIVGAKGGQVIMKTDGLPMRHSRSEGSLDTMVRKPADPEEELCWMAQEVRGYVEAVLNSLAANVPRAVVLCQVEKAKEDMLNKLYSSVSSQSTPRIEELLQEDGNFKRKRERVQKQSSLLSKLTRQLSIHDNRAAAASGVSNGTSPAESPRSSGPSSGDDWRSAFDGAANGPSSLSSRLSNGHSRRNSDPTENGDVGSGSRRTPNRLPPAPPGSGWWGFLLFNLKEMKLMGICWWGG